MRTLIIAAVAASSTLLAACFPLLPDKCATIACGACAPPLTVIVKSSDPALVPEVTIQGAQGGCGTGEKANEMICSLHEIGPGTYEFDLVAPKHQTVHVKETVAAVESEGCCSCGFEPKTVNVVMTALEE